MLNPQFYTMDIEDFFLMKKAYEDKILDEKRDKRRMALLIVSPWLKDAPSATKLWPLPGDKNIKRQANDYISEANRKWFEEAKKNPKVNINKINLN